MSVTIWHNPRCSKSRQALKLLEHQGITPTVRKYLDDPPTAAELSKVLGLLGREPRELMRKREAEYQALNLGDASKSRDELIAAMAAHPRLIERPVVLANGKAALGRPPEDVLEIL